MAYFTHHEHHKRNHHHNGWFPSNEYQEYEPTGEPAQYRRQPNKGHMEFRTNVYKEPINDEELRARAAETETAKERYERLRFGDHSASDNVDEEADAFIQFEHRRIEFAKLMSMRPK